MRSRFGDFVINRISNPRIIEDSPIEEHELKDDDIQWSRIVGLEIVPHPRLKYPETIEQEYDMVDGRLRVNIRAAVAGYVLRYWNVDCTKDHSLDGPEYTSGSRTARRFKYLKKGIPDALSEQQWHG